MILSLIIPAAILLVDIWLRRRNDKYELKYPPADRVDSVVQQYKESIDEMFIRQHVTDIINKKSAAEVGSSVYHTDQGINAKRGFFSV